MSTPFSPTSRRAVRINASVLTVPGPLGNAGSDREGTGCTQHCQLTRGTIPKRPANPVIQNQLPKDRSGHGSGLRDALHIALTHDSSLFRLFIPFPPSDFYFFLFNHLVCLPGNQKTGIDPGRTDEKAEAGAEL